MKKLLLFTVAVFITVGMMAQIAGTWKVANEAGSIGVGPGQGDISWWSIDEAGLTQRACYFDDYYVFNEDGSFMNYLGSQTWLEVWQGVEADGCGAPIAPHDGSNAATWTWDDAAGELTLNGVGAFLGLSKVINGGELAAPGDAPESITYLVEFSEDGSRITVDIAVGGEGWWRFILDKASPIARVQAIHNSADLAAAVVDVWLNDTKLIENFAFRTASPFIDAPAGEEFTIAIQGPGSTSPDNPIWSQAYTLDAFETYVLVANGIVSPSGYDPVQPFDIYVYPMGRESSMNTGETDVLVFHGSTDAPTVSVWEVGAGAGELFTFSYGDFAGYLELATSDYILEVRDETGTTTVAAYDAPLAALGLEGQALSIMASGFLDPSMNSDGAAFGLWVALAGGGELIELGAPAPSIPVTMNVDMSGLEGFDPATHSVYVSGSIFGWPEPGTNPDLMLTRVDETLIYTISASLAEPGEIQYKYFTDAVAEGWDGGEWTGDPNRKVYVLAEATLDDVFADKPVETTFMVDMTDAEVFDPENDAIYMAGTVNIANNWQQPGTDASLMMSPNADNPMMYEATLLLPAGTYLYKYFRVINGEASWDNGEWEGEPNREVAIDTLNNMISDTWGSAASINDPEAGPIASIYPNPVSNELNITFFDNNAQIRKIEVFNVTGAVVKVVQGSFAGTVRINTSDLVSGVYMIAVHSNQGIQSTKFVKE
jgi:hypothetical protein